MIVSFNIKDETAQSIELMGDLKVLLINILLINN